MQKLSTFSLLFDECFSFNKLVMEICKLASLNINNECQTKIICLTSRRPLETKYKNAVTFDGNVFL